MTHASPRRTAGFTLIEVLAALVIVALGMMAAIQAVSQAGRNGTYLRDKTLAHWIGMNVITERRLAQQPPDVADSTGQVDYAGQKWQWTMKVTQTQVESLRRMDVSVRFADADEKSSLATVTGFYGTVTGGASAGAPSLAWEGSGAPGTGGGEDQSDDPEGTGSEDHGKSPGRPRIPVPGNEPPDEEAE